MNDQEAIAMAERIIQIESDVKHINEKLDNLNDNVSALVKVINGNGKPGIKTDLEVTRASVKVHHWLIGIMFTSQFGLAGLAIRMMVLNK